jgi:hypothetical protein
VPGIQEKSPLIARIVQANSTNDQYTNAAIVNTKPLFGYRAFQRLMPYTGMGAKKLDFDCSRVELSNKKQRVRPILQVGGLAGGMDAVTLSLLSVIHVLSGHNCYQGAKL